MTWFSIPEYIIFWDATGWPCASEIFCLSTPTVSGPSTSIYADMRHRKGGALGVYTWKTFCWVVFTVIFMVVVGGQEADCPAGPDARHINSQSHANTILALNSLRLLCGARLCPTQWLRLLSTV